MFFIVINYVYFKINIYFNCYMFCFIYYYIYEIVVV